MNRHILSIFSVAVLGLASAAQAQFPMQFPDQAQDLLDIDALRNQFMQNSNLNATGLAWSSSSSQSHMPHAIASHPNVNAIGFATIPFPAYLRTDALPLPQDGGQLIVAVVEGSIAHQVGLRAGMTIREFDRLPLASTTDLSQLEGLHLIEVLTDEGPRQIDLAIDQESEFAGFGVQPNPLRSIAVSEANGILAVSALIDTENGPERIELKGSRAQVEAKLRQLSPQVQETLRAQLR